MANKDFNDKPVSNITQAVKHVIMFDTDLNEDKHDFSVNNQQAMHLHTFTKAACVRILGFILAFEFVTIAINILIITKRIS